MKGIFQVFEKETVEYNNITGDFEAKRVNVYKVKEDDVGRIYFLIWDNGWKWSEADKYIPEILDFEFADQKSRE